MRKRYTASDRERLVGEVEASGDPVRVVAARQGVAGSVAYLWMRGSKKGSKTEAPRFARVVRSSEVAKAITIEVGSARVRVESDFDAKLLREVLGALKGLT